MAMNVAAPLNSLGYGVVGLNTVLALEATGAEPALWPIGGVDVDQGHVEALRRMVGRQAHYNPRAPSLRIFHQFDLAQHVGKGPHCAMPIFELDRFKPNEVHHLKAQDFVFANSHWAGEVLVENGVPRERIQYAPLGVDTSVFRPATEPREGFTQFINIGKWEYRKGHDVLLEAFNKAFEPGDNVNLLMHCHNPCLPGEDGQRYNADWERAYKSCRLAEKVTLTGGRFPTQAAVAMLMRTSDCGVFPSRAEGWGLESAEMLAMGKHVILTDYSAHTEYADETNAHLIRVDQLEDAHDGYWFRADDPSWQGKPGRWARMSQDQVDLLVEHMRRIHTLKQAGELNPNVAGVESMKRFTWANTAAEILAVLG